MKDQLINRVNIVDVFECKRTGRVVLAPLPLSRDLPPKTDSPYTVCAYALVNHW